MRPAADPAPPRRYVLPSRHAVPDFLPITLFGVTLHLTMRQGLLLLLGWSLAWQGWRASGWCSGLGRLAPVAHVLLPVTLAVATPLLALLRPGGRALERWLLLLLRFGGRPRRLRSQPQEEADGAAGAAGSPADPAPAPRPRRRRFPRRSHVQRRLVAARRVADDVLCVRLSGRAGRLGEDYVAVLLLLGPDTTLWEAQAREQQAEQLRAWLATLPYPVQLLWRLLPCSSEAVCAPFAHRLGAPSTPAACSSLLVRGASGEAEQAELLQRQLASAEQRHLAEHGNREPLLVHRCYLIVRLWANEARQGTDSRPAPPRWRAGSRGPARLEAARRELGVRCAELRRQLGSMQLTSRRLRGPGELLPFYYSCLTALRAAQMPLSPAWLAEVARPVVRRRPPRPWEGPARSSAAQNPAITTANPTIPAARPVAAPQILARLPTLCELLAPATVEIEAATLHLDEEFARLFVGQQVPHEVRAGWLAPLAASPESVEVSFHLHPLPRTRISAHLRRQLASYQSVLLMAERQGSLSDPATAQAVAELEDLLARLSSQQDQMLSLTWVLLVRGGSREELEGRCARLAARLQQMGVRAQVARFEQEAALRACLPQADCPLEHPLLLDSQALSSFLPFLPAPLWHPGGVLEGLTEAGEPVVLARWHRSLPNANRLILGRSGSGKSYHAKLTLLHTLLAEQARRLGGQGHAGEQDGVQTLVLDPDGEWVRLARAVGGQVIRLSAGAPLPLNPFALPVPTGQSGSEQEADLRLAEHLAHLHDLLDLMLADSRPDGRGGRLGQAHKGVLDRALRATYAAASISADPATQQRPAPHLADLDAQLARFSEPEAQDLRSRLHRYVSGSFSACFAGQGTRGTLSAPLLVFDGRELKEEVQSLALFLVAHLVWQLARTARRPRQFIVDEAASLLSHESGAHFLEDLVRRARKHYLAVTLILHQADLLRGRALAAGCATHLLFGQEAAAVGAVAELEGLSAEERRVLGRLGTGQALLLVGGQHRLIQRSASPLAHLLASTHPVERQAWQQAVPSWATLSPQLAEVLLDQQEPLPPANTQPSQEAAASNGQVPTSGPPPILW